MEKKASNCILVPVDFSPHSEAALLLAHQYARCFDAKVLVLHVVHDPGEEPGYYAKSFKKKRMARMEDSAMDMLNEFLDKLAKSNKVLEGLKNIEPLLIKGLPTTRILEVAEKRNAFMIVMGSTGRTGLKHLLLGSVAERVVQLSPVPVIVAKIKKK